MKTIQTIFFILCITLGAQGQNTVVDSLSQRLQSHSKEDSIRVTILNELAQAMHQTNTDQAVTYLNQADIILQSISFKKGEARSLFIKGLIEFNQSKLNEAIPLFEQALALYKEIDNKQGVAESFDKLGLSKYYAREYDQAIEYLKESVSINESIGNFKNTALSLKHIGYAYSDIDNFDQALFHYEKAITINKQYDNKIELASCFNNVGILYADRSNSTLVALDYYNKSLVVSEEIKDSLGMLKAINNLGNIYMLNENFPKAIEKFERSLDIQDRSGIDIFQGISLNNLGNIYKKQRQYNRALPYLTQSLEISRARNDLYTASTTLANIGGIYRAYGDNSAAIKVYNESVQIKQAIKDEYGECTSLSGLAYTLIAQNKLEKALAETKKAQTIADKLNIIGLQRDIYDLYSRIYKGKGEYKKAFENYEQFKILNDSLFNKQNIEKLASIEYEYKYKRALDSASIREMTLTQKVRTTSNSLEKSQRNIFLTIIAFLATAILLGGIIFYLKLRNEKAKTQNIAIEQKLLRSQMTPHFIFNSLSVLQGMILNKEEKKSVSYLGKFSKLLRITLENSRDKMVPLEQELEAIDNYMDLQNLDANPPFIYALSIGENIDKSSFEIPPMLIQPFVENAIEHAFVNQKSDRIINVDLSYDKQRLVCAITDNGIGIDTMAKATNGSKKSLATAITNERLAMLAKEFKQEADIIIEDRQKYNEQGTLVTLVIPYIKNRQV